MEREGWEEREEGMGGERVREGWEGVSDGRKGERE